MDSIGHRGRNGPLALRRHSLAAIHGENMAGTSEHFGGSLRFIAGKIILNHHKIITKSSQNHHKIITKSSQHHHKIIINHLKTS
jgi:ABC-type uncharacterized transport system ATPase component